MSESCDISASQDDILDINIEKEIAAQTLITDFDGKHVNVNSLFSSPLNLRDNHTIINKFVQNVHSEISISKIKNNNPTINLLNGISNKFQQFQKMNEFLIYEINENIIENVHLRATNANNTTTEYADHFYSLFLYLDAYYKALLHYDELYLQFMKKFSQTSISSKEFLKESESLISKSKEVNVLYCEVYNSLISLFPHIDNTNNLESMSLLSTIKKECDVSLSSVKQITFTRKLKNKALDFVNKIIETPIVAFRNLKSKINPKYIKIGLYFSQHITVIYIVTVISFSIGFAPLASFYSTGNAIDLLIAICRGVCVSMKDPTILGMVSGHLTQFILKRYVNVSATISQIGKSVVGHTLTYLGNMYFINMIRNSLYFVLNAICQTLVSATKIGITTISSVASGIPIFVELYSKNGDFVNAFQEGVINIIGQDKLDAFYDGCMNIFNIDSLSNSLSFMKDSIFSNTSGDSSGFINNITIDANANISSVVLQNNIINTTQITNTIQRSITMEEKELNTLNFILNSIFSKDYGNKIKSVGNKLIEFASKDWNTLKGYICDSLYILRETLVNFTNKLAAFFQILMKYITFMNWAKAITFDVISVLTPSDNDKDNHIIIQRTELNDLLSKFSKFNLSHYEIKKLKLDNEFKKNKYETFDYIKADEDQLFKKNLAVKQYNSHLSNINSIISELKQYK
jgi:hypothetical protein